MGRFLFLEDRALVFGGNFMRAPRAASTTRPIPPPGKPKMMLPAIQPSALVSSSPVVVR